MPPLNAEDRCAREEVVARQLAREREDELNQKVTAYTKKVRTGLQQWARDHAKIFVEKEEKEKTVRMKQEAEERRRDDVQRKLQAKRSKFIADLTAQRDDLARELHARKEAIAAENARWAAEEAKEALHAEMTTRSASEEYARLRTDLLGLVNAQATCSTPAAFQAVEVSIASLKKRKSMLEDILEINIPMVSHSRFKEPVMISRQSNLSTNVIADATHAKRSAGDGVNDEKAEDKKRRMMPRMHGHGQRSRGKHAVDSRDTTTSSSNDFVCAPGEYIDRFLMNAPKDTGEPLQPPPGTPGNMGRSQSHAFVQQFKQRLQSYLDAQAR